MAWKRWQRFLNPTADFQVNHSVIDGSVIGGDTANSPFVSSNTLTAPTAPGVPEPGSLALLGSARAALGLIGRRRKSA
jgi:hypothetical protein